MIIPKIKINGKEVKAKEPKLKIWRKLVKFQGSEVELNSEEGIDLMLDFFGDVFNESPEILEENIDLSEFLPLFTEIGEWIAELVQNKNDKMGKQK